MKLVSPSLGILALTSSILLCTRTAGFDWKAIPRLLTNKAGDPFVLHLCYHRIKVFDKDVTMRGVACQKTTDHYFDTTNVKILDEDRNIKNGDDVYTCGYLLTGAEANWYTWTPNAKDFCAIYEGDYCHGVKATNDINCPAMDDKQMDDWKAKFKKGWQPGLWVWRDQTGRKH